MAQVFLGHHEGLGRPVAVKRLHRQLADPEQARARLAAEAEIARTIHHDHIVDILDLVTDPAGDSYLVMEHVTGEPLADRIARVGALLMSETLTIALQVADAMSALHRRGIVHRDLKTENVLVGLDPVGALVAKLIDFGVAEILGNPDRSPDGSIECGTVVGTPESMSPEQARGEQVDRRSDIYSFGVLLYEMVAGCPPFQGDDLTHLLRRVVSERPLRPSLMPGAQKQLIPRQLEQLIMECLAKQPELRPQDMTEVSLRLELVAAEYRALIGAVDRAIAEDECVPAVRHAPSREDVVRVPLQPPSWVRAVGTSDEGLVPPPATGSTTRATRVNRPTPGRRERPWHR